MSDSVVLAIAVAAAIGAGALFIWRRSARGTWGDSWRPPSPKDGAQGSGQLDALVRVQREKGAAAAAMVDRIEKVASGLERVDKLTNTIQVLARRVDEMGSRLDGLSAQGDGGGGRRYDKLVGELREVAGRVKLLEDEMRRLLGPPREKSTSVEPSRHVIETTSRDHVVQMPPPLPISVSAGAGGDKERSYIRAYNANPLGFSSRFPTAKRFGLASPTRRVTVDTPGLFKFGPGGELALLPTDGDEGVAFPDWRSEYGIQLETSGMTQVFASNYQKGKTYEKIEVKKPARFRAGDGGLTFRAKGELVLTEKKPL